MVYLGTVHTYHGKNTYIGEVTMNEEERVNPRIKTYTINEVAKLLQIHRDKVSAYIKNGYLPAVKFGKVWRIREIDLEEFVAKGAPTTPEEQAKYKRRKAQREPQKAQAKEEPTPLPYGGITAKKHQ